METEKKADVQTVSVQEEKKEVSEPLLLKINAKSTLGLKPTTNFAKNLDDKDTKKRNTSNDDE